MASISNSSNTAGAERPTIVRHVVIFVTTLAAVLLYLDRICVSTAAEYIRQDLGFSQTDMSWFLGAFFYTYALAQVPAGWLGDRYGARAVMVLYILTWSLFTGLLGLATSLAFVLAMRFGCGLGQAGAYPTAGGLIGKWVPFSNRGFASSLVAFGGRVGGAIAPLLTPLLIVLLMPRGVPLQFEPGDLLNPGRLCAKLAPLDGAGGNVAAGKPKVTSPSPAGQHVWALLPDTAKQLVGTAAAKYRGLEAAGSDAKAKQALAKFALSPADLGQLAAALNEVMSNDRLYDKPAFKNVRLERETRGPIQRLDEGQGLTGDERKRLNRFLLEGVFNEDVRKLYVHGWRPVMYVYGALGLLVAAAFWFSFRNRPDEHPGCNRAEQELILGGPSAAPSPRAKAGMVPVGRLMGSIDMWLNSLMQFTTNVGWVFLITWLPRFLGSAHKVTLDQQGVMQFVVLVIGFVGMLLGGKITDALVPYIGLRWGRCLPMAITRFTAALGFGLCLWFSTFTGGTWINGPWAFTLAFSLVALSTDMGNPALWAYVQDVGGRHTGSVLGWGNMWGNFGAAVAPQIYNHYLGETPGVSEWNTMFAICAGSFVVSGICALGINANRPVIPADVP